jgi:phosphatidate phosphatase APP1
MDLSASHVASQPHWSARAQDVTNAAAGRVLDRIGCVLRIRPLTGLGTPGHVRVLARVLWARPSAPADHHDKPVYDMHSMARRGWRNFISQPAPHQEVRVRIGTQETVARADRTGLVDETLPLDLAPGVHEVEFSTTADNAVTAEVFVHAADAPFGVVSDVDDTVMATFMPRPLLAFWNAFIIHQTSRQIVPGMPMLYQRVARQHPSAPFLYLSTGAWNVFPVLQRFLYKNGYPDGPLLLTNWGPSNTGLFPPGRVHKERTLERLSNQFPDTRWLLIGDDGQHDPEIYGDFATRHPERVAAVAIRELSGSEQMLAHGTPHPIAPEPVPPEVVWVCGHDGHTLLEALRREGVIA